MNSPASTLKGKRLPAGVAGQATKVDSAHGNETARLRMSVLDELRRGDLLHIPLSDASARSMPLSLLVRAGRELPIAPSALLDRLIEQFDDYVGDSILVTRRAFALGLH